MNWTRDNIRRLAELVEAKPNYTEVGATLGITANAVKQAVWLYLRQGDESRAKRDAARREAYRVRNKGRKRTRIPNRWTEEFLTETWAERKARRAADASA